MFNGRMYFLGAIYNVRGEFSHLPSFTRRFAVQFNSLPYERNAVLEKVQRLCQEYTNVRKPIGNEEALKLMLAKDLYAIEKVLRNEDIVSDLDREQNIFELLNRCKEKAVDQLISIGIAINSPSLFVVEKLPLPYMLKDYAALTADEGDRAKYGIEPGIYFPQNRLRPFYSEFILAHEMIHIIMGKRSPDLLARGLEEGLAELIGAMYLSTKILGKELTINLFIYNRLSHEFHRFWELYMDATRQATMLYHRFGLAGIIELMQGGREELKRVEDLCLRMEFDKITLNRGKFDEELSDIADFLSLVFNRNLVVSPLAKYLSSFVHPHQRVSEILANAEVERIAGIEALKELESRVQLVTFSNDYENFDDAVVVWTDCDRLCEGSAIRYEIPVAEIARK